MAKEVLEEYEAWLNRQIEKRNIFSYRMVRAIRNLAMLLLAIIAATSTGFAIFFVVVQVILTLQKH